MQTELSRRTFVANSIAAAAPALLAASALPGEGAEAEADSTTGRLLKVVCVGGHPDDLESGCAGTLARYASAGHEVTILYLTRGERGIKDKTNDEAARIRSAECEAACKIMGARAIFAGQIDGSSELNKSRVAEVSKLVAAENPDIIFTHWPIDTHFDHQVASIAAIRAWMSLAKRAQLYFFEVNTGSQSLGFAPNTYVDVTPVLEQKKSALLAHVSQNGEEIWRKHHEIVANFRGREAGVSAAEAFVHLPRNNPVVRLPGL